MATIYGSHLAHVDEQRAADIYRLGQAGDGQCARIWAEYERAQPELARLAKSFALSSRQSAYDANAIADTLVKAAKDGVRSANTTDAVIKGKAMCVKCHAMMKRTQVRCGQCGKKNPHFVAKKGPSVGNSFKRAKKNAARARKYAQKAGEATSKAAWSAAAGVPVSSPGEAMNAMWRHNLASPDPAIRQAAEKFFQPGYVLFK